MDKQQILANLKALTKSTNSVVAGFHVSQLGTTHYGVGMDKRNKADKIAYETEKATFRQMRKNGEIEFSEQSAMVRLPC